MDNKKSMLFTVIAVATLLVSVVGATFAYFALGQSSTQKGSSASVTTKGAAGSVLASGGGKSLLLNVTSAQMQEAYKGTTYHAVTSGNPVTTDQNHEIAKFAVTTPGDLKYTCTFTFTVKSTGMSAVKAGEGQVILKPSTGVTLSGGTSFNYADIATAKTISGTVVLNKTTTTATIGADATLVNTTSEQQDYLASLNGSVTISAIQSFTCTVSD